MRRKELEMILQRVRPFAEPDPAAEQYPTPASIASDMLFTAFSLGDVQDRKVADLGCGTGILAIAASLLGAEEVVGVDKDPKALELAEGNARDLGARARFLLSDVGEFQGSFDTVVMNPPFGSQTRHADRPFLEKAMEVAPVTYSLHNAVTHEFLLRMVSSAGAEAQILKRYKLEIPHTFAFHKKARKDVDVLLLRIQTR